MAALIVLLAIGRVICLVPSIVAVERGHHQTMAIVALNIFTGWTFIGWVAALVWSLTMVVRVQGDRGTVPLTGQSYFGPPQLLGADHQSERSPERRLELLVKIDPPKKHRN
jgi:hypothetical protein